MKEARQQQATYRMILFLWNTQNSKSMKTESSLVVVWCSERGKWGGLLKGVGFPFGVMWFLQHGQWLRATELYTFCMVKMVTGLCLFFLTKKKKEGRRKEGRKEGRNEERKKRKERQGVYEVRHLWVKLNSTLKCFGIRQVIKARTCQETKEKWDCGQVS